MTAPRVLLVLMMAALLGPFSVGQIADAHAATSDADCLTRKAARDPGRVMKCIRERSTSAVLAELRKDEDDEMWDKVTDAIWNGKDEWLKIAVELRKVSDAGASFDLEVAWSNAVIKNPVGSSRCPPLTPITCSTSRQSVGMRRPWVIRSGKLSSRFILAERLLDACTGQISCHNARRA